MLLKRDKSVLLVIDVQEKLTPLVVDAEALVDSCRWLVELARDLEVPYLWSEQYPSGLGATVSKLGDLVDKGRCFDKFDFSCQQEPTLSQYLANMEKTQLVLCGIEAHVCVLQSAFEFKEQGYEVFVVADALSTRNADDKAVALQRMQQQQIQIVSREMVFFEWLRTSKDKQFKQLSQKYLK